jgi:hypothetical protein
LEAVDVCEAEAIVNDAEILEIESAELILVGGVVDTGALPVVVVGATDNVSLSVMLMYWLANPFGEPISKTSKKNLSPLLSSKSGFPSVPLKSTTQTKVVAFACPPKDHPISLLHTP